jgi:hypothetical protein
MSFGDGRAGAEEKRWVGKGDRQFVIGAKTGLGVRHNEKCQPRESGVHCTQPKTPTGGWQMQCITGWRNGQWCEVAHTIAVLGLVILAIEGIRLESHGGWVACPPRWVRIEQARQRGRSIQGGIAWSVGWAWMRRSCVVALVRSETLLLLAVLPGREEWEWVCLLPWASWLWRGIGVACPRWRGWMVYRGVDCLLEEASRLALFGLVLMWLLERQQSTGDEFSVSGMGLGCVTPSAWVEIVEDKEGICHVRLPGGLDPSTSAC